MKKDSRPPEHLSLEAKRTWKALLAEWPSIGDVAGLRILRVALESFDRAQEARQTMDKDGMTVVDKFGQTKPHPLLPIERDSRAAFLSGLKALNLDLEPLRDRPGRPGGR
jgi:P27 family predicted phage terminase small subunit